MKLTITTMMMTLLMGLSYTDEFEFKSLENDNKYKFNNKSLEYNNYDNDYNSDSYNIIAYTEIDSFGDQIIDFVIARCNDGAIDHADSIYEACYYNGGINFVMVK